MHHIARPSRLRAAVVCLALHSSPIAVLVPLRSARPHSLRIVSHLFIKPLVFFATTLRCAALLFYSHSFFSPLPCFLLPYHDPLTTHCQPHTNCCICTLSLALHHIRNFELLAATIIASHPLHIRLTSAWADILFPLSLVYPSHRPPTYVWGRACICVGLPRGVRLPDILWHLRASGVGLHPPQPEANTARVPCKE